MSSGKDIMISSDNGKIQLPYAEYLNLMEKAEETKRIRETQAQVLADLRAFLDGNLASEAWVDDQEDLLEQDADTEIETPIETSPEEVAVEVSNEPLDEDVELPEGEPVVASVQSTRQIDVPSIKQEIAAHFNERDESGRLFSVFQQYYAFLNDACGGTVRVTMKDGICSLWNYDEWEEFAYVDIHEEALRITIHDRYTDDVFSLNLCEVPRLLASRRRLISIAVGDLSNTMLDVLSKAFHEVGVSVN